jgi:hypothetical protein
LFLGQARRSTHDLKEYRRRHYRRNYLQLRRLSEHAAWQRRSNGAADDAARTTDPTLVRMLSKANCWMQALQDGTALIEITRRDDHAESYVSTRIPLAFLSPRIQAAILDGTRPRHLSLEHILRVGIPLDWIEQERIFGFNGHTAPSLF